MGSAQSCTVSMNFNPDIKWDWTGTRYVIDFGFFMIKMVSSENDIQAKS